MKVETFIASDMRTAMAQVRLALGNDAVIISSRRVGDQTEIRAARETAEGDVPRIQSSQPEPAAPDVAPVIQNIQDELGRLRMLFEGELQQLNWREMGRHQPNRLALINRLELGGVDKELAAIVVDKVLPCADIEQGWSRALGFLGKKIALYPRDILNEGGVIALLGSTGVGKTTTAAKIAAQFALRHGRKHVAFISTDRYKVGGQEQLVSFGSILGVPVQIATTAEEMKRTLDSLSERRLVIIDTAGMSQRDMSLADQFDALSIERPAGSPIQPLLVLPATARSGIIEETIRAFAQVNVTGAILTKLDECDAIGPLASSVIRHDLPLAFVTNGQHVPDNLHAAEPKEILADIIRNYRQSLANAATAGVRLQAAI